MKAAIMILGVALMLGACGGEEVCEGDHCVVTDHEGNAPAVNHHTSQALLAACTGSGANDPRCVPIAKACPPPPGATYSCAPSGVCTQWEIAQTFACLATGSLSPDCLYLIYKCRAQ